MALTEQEMRQQADITAEALNRVLNAQRSGSTGTTGGGPRASGSGAGDYIRAAIDPFGRAVNGSIDVLRGFTTGTYNASSALNTFGSVAGAFGPAGKALSGAVTGITAGMMDVNNSLKLSSQNGLYFGQNLGLYDRAILNSRMSLGEFNDLIRNNNRQLYGLGMNMDYAALTYLKLGKKLQDDPLTYNLIATGMGMEEFNKTLLLAANNNKKLDLTRADNQDKVLASAMGLAVELDNVARLTGKNKDAMRKEIEDRQLTTRWRLTKATLSAEELAGAERAIARSEVYGANAKKTAEIFASGGPMSKTETEIVATQTPEMQRLIQQLVKVKGEGTEADDERRRIQYQMDLEVQRNSNKATLESQKALSVSGNKVAEGIATSSADYFDRVTQVNAERVQMEKEGYTDLIAYRKYKEEQLAKDRTVGQATEGKAAVASQTINRADILMKDISKGVAIGFDKLNTSVGGLIGGINGLHKVLRPFTDAEIEKAARNALRTVTPGQASGRRDTSTVTPPRVESNAFGTKDNYGSWFAKDWGDGGLSKLHGKEAIVPEAKIGEFINDMMSSAKMPTGQITSGQVPNMFGNVTNDLKGELAKVKDMMPTTASFEKIFSQFKMPDFGEITRNMPQASAPTRSVSADNEAMTDMARGIDSLNTRMERLITAVTDGSDKSVRALKTRGNALS